MYNWPLRVMTPFAFLAVGASWACNAKTGGEVGFVRAFRDASRQDDVIGMTRLLNSTASIPRTVYMELERKCASSRLLEAEIGIVALSRAPNKGQYRAMVELYAAASPRVRFRLLYGLGILGDPAAVPFLLEVLKQGRDEEKLAADYALSLIKNGRTGHEPLEAAGYIASRPSSFDLVPGVLTIREPSFEEKLQSYKRWWEENRADLIHRREASGDYWAER